MIGDVAGFAPGDEAEDGGVDDAGIPVETGGEGDGDGFGEGDGEGDGDTCACCGATYICHAIADNTTRRKTIPNK